MKRFRSSSSSGSGKGKGKGKGKGWLTFHDRHEQKPLQGHRGVGQGERQGLHSVIKRYVLVRRQPDLICVDRGFVMADYISRFK